MQKGPQDKKEREGQSSLEYFILLALIVGLTIVSLGPGRNFLDRIRKSQQDFVGKAHELIAGKEVVEHWCGDGTCDTNECGYDITDSSHSPCECLSDCGISEQQNCEGDCTYTVEKNGIKYRPNAGCSGCNLPAPDNCYCEPGETSSTTWDCVACFLKGTRIALPGGLLKAIEEIKIGDILLGYRAGKIGAARVKRIFRHREVKGYFILTTDKGEIKVTGEHPVFIGNGYKKVNRVRNTDTVFRMNGNSLEPLKVKSIIFQPAAVEVYNLEVEKTHNFFAEGVLFHNKPEKPQEWWEKCSD